MTTPKSTRQRARERAETDMDWPEVERKIAERDAEIRADMLCHCTAAADAAAAATIARCSACAAASNRVAAMDREVHAADLASMEATESLVADLRAANDRLAAENNHLRATLDRALQGYDASPTDEPPADKT